MVRMNLRIARIQNRLSQKELALKIGVSQQTVAKWERGATTPAEFKTIRTLANELDTPAERLFPDVFSPDQVAE